MRCTDLEFHLCTAAPHADEPGEDNKDGSQSNYWSHYWEIAGTLIFGYFRWKEDKKCLFFFDMNQF